MVAKVGSLIAFSHSEYIFGVGYNALIFNFFDSFSRQTFDDLACLFTSKAEVFASGMVDIFICFDDTFLVPHSRHTTVHREDVESVDELRVLSSSEEAGVFVVSTDRGRQIFVTGHSEYDADTLKREYLRDKSAGLPIAVPKNYFPNDDDTKEPVVRWRSCANLFYSNWLNYFVYQTTPYDITKIQ